MDLESAKQLVQRYLSKAEAECNASLSGNWQQNAGGWFSLGTRVPLSFALEKLREVVSPARS
jgi:hypothetical protein